MSSIVQMNVRRWLASGVVALVAALTCCSVSAQQAARGVLERTLGKQADRIELRQVEGGNGDWYSLSLQQGRLQVSGNSEVALAHGAYAYLQKIGAVSVSWEGRRAVLPAAFPAPDDVRVTSPFLHRAYLNTCTYGYTTPFWNWKRWQQEIDWMALHGIDMPLAMEGQEAIWQRVWHEFGVDDQHLADYFSGPAFTPWQRMGNIEGYRAPLPQAWIDAKRELQKKILKRMRALGMKPVLPAFAGYVPKSFAQAHPHARIYRMRAWEGFHETYWLDPADPLFAQIAKRFIDLYTQTYGEGGYYLADAFNEMLPPIADDGSDVSDAHYGDSIANSEETRIKAVPAELRDKRLAAYGRAIYQSIHDANPKATWVMQGWLFGSDKEFWTPDAIAAFLGDVPDNRLLVLDIGNDRYPGVWKNSSAFDGKHWIYGYVHNYGASNPVYGDFDFYRQDLQALLDDPQHGSLAGFGAFPEGLDNNSVVYEYLYHLAWEGPKQPWRDWVADYLHARYGHEDPQLLAAWDDLRASVYSTRYWTPRWWHSRAGAYLLFKRPTATITSFEGLPGDAQRLRKALDELLVLAPKYRDAAMFRYDLVEFARHYLDMRIDTLLQQAVGAYRQGRLADGDVLVGRITKLVGGLDDLVGGQQQTLADWTGEAAAYADGDAALRDYYVANARAQVSVWGGDGNLADYASKAWQGMYRDFYLQRWTRFFAAYREAAVSGQPFDEAGFTRGITRWEWQWVDHGPTRPRQPPADPVALLRTLLHEVDTP